MRARYEPLLKDAVTRWDINYLIGELIAELNASHTYRGGGDTESGESRGVARDPLARRAANAVSRRA